MQGSETEGSASDSDSDGCTAAESEVDIVDETYNPSPKKNNIRNKSRKVVRPEPLMCSDSEDNMPRPQRHKRNHASVGVLRAA